MDPDGDDQAVAKADGVLDHVQMAVGDGVKRAGIERDTGHKPPLPRPGRPGKPSLVPDLGRLFIWDRPMNQFWGSSVF